MRDNYVAKNANKFNRGGAHPDRSKYSRSTGMSKHGALDELDDDLDLENELEATAAFNACDAEALRSELYLSKIEDDWMTNVGQFLEPLHPEDFDNE